MQPFSLFRRQYTIRLFSVFLMMTALLLSGCKCNVKGHHCNALSVSMQGTGSGRVASLPEGIDCEPTCNQGFVDGTPLRLSATPYSGSEFVSWSGGCGGSEACAFIIIDDVQVTAEFSRLSTDLSSLITPYVTAADMSDIRQGFSTIADNDKWDFVHDGLDLYPEGNLKPYRAVCDGRVHWMYVGDEQVFLIVACNSAFFAGYNFETQEPNTGHIQLANIQVSLGQQVSQGDVIGHLYAPNEESHVHFSMEKYGVPICPAPYFSVAAQTSMLNLLHVIHANADLCYGPEPSPPPLATPYVSEVDIAEIRTGFSTEYSDSPWGGVHDGLDIYPQADLKPFQATCAGTVDSVQLAQANSGANWQVKVLVQCDDYVDDPAEGGYFIPYSTEYVFNTLSPALIHGQQQLSSISVAAGQDVSPGDIIGLLHIPQKGAHLQFNLVQYASSTFSNLGVRRLPLCPEPHFSVTARDSVSNLLRRVWPTAHMCYQN